MFARMRLAFLTTLLIVAPVLAKEKTLCKSLSSSLSARSSSISAVTSSVTYCAPPESLLVQQFDITYFNANRSVSFNISAASVVCRVFFPLLQHKLSLLQEQDVKVTASLLLNVYGIKPVNLTINLCDILDGALCPLPTYNFVGADSLSLASLDVDITSRLPGIAFIIPDLEGYAQLVLTEVGTGDIKACVQATLSNGWSMSQPAVPWATAGVALVTLVSAAWQSLSPRALLPYRLMDLLYLYQTIASSAFLNLNYPVVFRAYALNFAWAMGLVHSTSMQASIDAMRHRTGGNMANSTGSSAVEFVNRELSPYNELRGRSLDSVERFTPHVFVADYRTLSSVATVTSTSSNILDAGIPTYVNSLSIASANAFMTVFLCLLIFYAIALAVFALVFGVLWALGRYQPKHADRCMELRSKYPAFVRAWALRLVCSSISDCT